MALRVAVQMDPIERIRVAGDSTFALLLEAQKRRHALSYYTPDRLALVDGKLYATVRPLSVRDKAGDHFTLGKSKRVSLSSFAVVLMRQDPPFDLAYITATHLLERIQPKTLVVNDPAEVRNAPEKMFVIEFADAALARPRRDPGLSRPTRRRGDEAALRQWRRGGISRGPPRRELRLA